VLRATIRIDPKRARELVSNLADLYRYLLSHPDDAPLRDEVNHARAYLEIESVRLGDGRLRVEVELTPEVESLRVPALLLQPLVENAVKHGIGSRTGRGTVGIRARIDGRDLLIEVEDSSEGPRREAGPLSFGAAERSRHDLDDDARPGTGIALKTLRQRLAQLYGRRSELVLTPTAHGMVASVRLPTTTEGAPLTSDEAAQ
jgi:LytS/YehU family sensor histidine kinase